MIAALCWMGLSLAERRDGSYALSMRYFGEGFSSGTPGGPTVKNLYRRDHLGSVREVVDENGGVTRQEFDLWGVRSGNNTTSDFGFTGHYTHRRSELALAPYRAYSPDQARWLSRDPIEESGGMNLYGYVENRSILYLDSLGLDLDITGNQAIDAGLTACSRAAQGILNALSGGLFDPSDGLFYGDFNRQWEDLGEDSNDGDSSFRSGTNGCRTAVATLSVAGGLQSSGINPWIGSVQRHAAHAGGPHQYPHLQFMLRTGAHRTSHWRIRLGR